MGEFAKKLLNSSSVENDNLLETRPDEFDDGEATTGSKLFAASLTKKFKESSAVDTARRVLENNVNKASSKKAKPISLKRYGSGANQLSVDPSRALNPFLYTPDSSDDNPTNTKSDFVIPRVSISDVVDLFSPGGRRRLVAALFSKSKLVEPTYQELIVIHRPVVPPPSPPPFFKRIPNFIYNLAEIFNIDQKLPARWESPPPEIQQAQMKVFTDVPCSNVLACLPKSKLVLRPADALRLDLISALTGLAVLATLR